jgi:hypothetical protein
MIICPAGFLLYGVTCSSHAYSVSWSCCCCDAAMPVSPGYQFHAPVNGWWYDALPVMPALRFASVADSCMFTDQYHAMWTCPLCNQPFKNNNQQHSCNEKLLTDFLTGKSAHTVALFWHFVEEYRKLAPITVHPTKSMIAIAFTKRIAWITRLGKNFVDIVFPLESPYEDNLCFHKIAQVPGTNQFNHHFRMMRPEDLNEELHRFMLLAVQQAAG